jgi:dephospho-CoA kinase
VLNVALTGNIAAGKSEVVRRFAEWGATVIDADQLAREAQEPGTEVLRAIVQRFGKGVLNADGTLDRPALRGLVMSDEAALATLNGIVHPAVRRRRDQLLAEARARGDRVVLSDIPLLFEAADPAAFDVVVLVDAPEPLRRERLISLRGLSGEEADRMIRAQIPAEVKRSRADIVIDNAGTLAELDVAARTAWDELLRRAPRHP